MGIFIYGPNASYLNVNRIEKAERTDSGRYRIIIDGLVADENNAEFESKIVSIIPVSGQWEVLTLVGEDDGHSSLSSEPILAWGLTLLGKTVPVTPTQPHGVSEGHAVRKIGSPEVYVENCAYESLEDWMQSMATPVRATIVLTQGSLNNSYLQLTSALAIFPTDSIGSSSASNSAENRITVTFEPGGSVDTDIDGTKKIFRARSEVSKFLTLSSAKEGDFVDIERVEPYRYKVSLRRKQ